MLLRPQSRPLEAFRLLPLGLMLGALVGLLCGAVSANLPFLASFGPHFGRLATIWGAALGGFASLAFLVVLRRWFLVRTSFQLDRDSLKVQWPGHSAQFEWASFIGSERTTAGLLLCFREDQIALLFGLADLDQAEDLIRGRAQSQERSLRIPLAA